MHLDHVSYAVSPEAFASTWQRLGGCLRASFTDGGVHPGFGTRNAILPLAGGSYVEVVTTLDHPAADRMPFGQAVKARGEAGGGWLGWVVSVDDLAPFEQRLGRPGVDGHRTRPDGVDLRWRQIGVLDLIRDPQLPFFISWEAGAPHPSQEGRPALRITALEMAGDQETLETWLGTRASQPLGDVDLRYVDDPDGERGLVAVEFDTPNGPVRLD